MARAGEINNYRCPALSSVPLIVCALGVALLVAPGCQGTNGSKAKQGDPLVGETPPPATSIGPTPPSPGQNRAAVSTPQTPQSTASKSIADILVQAEPLDGTKKLAIADTQPANNGGWQPRDAQPVGLQGAPVVLRQPQPATDQTGGIVPVAPPNTAPNSAPATQTSPLPVPQYTGGNPDPWQAQLQARGVIWQKQDPVAAGVCFTCAVPNAQDPTSQRIYSATASDAASAIQAVLQQIDQNRSR